MINSLLYLSGTLHWYNISSAIKYGKQTLNKDLMDIVLTSLKRTFIHILLWIIIAGIFGTITVVISKQIFDVEHEKVLSSYDASTYHIGVRVSPTTVQYTRGESHYFDVTTLGLNLDDDFPNYRRFIIFVDENENLKGILPKGALDKITYIYPFGWVASLVVMLIILLPAVLYIRLHSSYGRPGTLFMKWIRTNNEKYIQQIAASC